MNEHLVSVDELLNFDVNDFMKLINNDADKLHDLETEESFLTVTSYKTYDDELSVILKFKFKEHEYSITIDQVESGTVVISGSDTASMAVMQETFTKKTGIKFLNNNNEEYQAITDREARFQYQAENVAEATVFSNFKGELSSHYNDYHVNDVLNKI